jgi:hypothetical protein
MSSVSGFGRVFLVGARSAPTTIFCVVFVVLYIVFPVGVGVKFKIRALKSDTNHFPIKIAQF